MFDEKEPVKRVKVVGYVEVRVDDDNFDNEVIREIELGNLKDYEVIEIEIVEE